MENQIGGPGRPQHPPEFLRKRRFYLILPLLTLPFLTMAFWALGGGTDHLVSPDNRPRQGLDLTLPSAQFKNDEKTDKMNAYQNAAKDTAANTTLSAQSFTATEGLKPKADTSVSPVSADEQSERINAKLADINRQLSQPQPGSYSPPAPHDPSGGRDVERLQRMMSNMKGNGDDPEMRQLSQVLKQISNIQNPGSENEILYASLKNKQRTYPVMAAANAENDGSADEVTMPAQKQMPNAIEAVVHEDQTLVSGAVVKLRLLNGVYVNGRFIPKGSFIYGSCALNNERLLIKISTVRYLNNILPVSLSVYDLDGMEGLYVPGSIGRDAAKDGATNAVQSLQLMSMSQGLGAQAAGAGIEAAKGLFGRKVKQIKVSVKAGYQVLLKDNNQRDI
ncbi:conjugative transposon protein TraM [Mucilaginibacter ginkgonis]|uniref:Conjugative transposon protein TraM n=1 Tax=Mucilaginibacter ginkgonis TaxID=2682091 RepID=A0A7T7JGX0_9SPHI|nr:conjugative transposon protein TraM [Mucilaginibacter ginkgonis]QQL49960.1 conjugative transposon protein TraM [Mucilaginibacter ginkgonis]